MFIRESIDSIIAQTFTDWELIIVDDCSTDDTPQIIREYSEIDDRIRIITNEKNMKLPASLNIGFVEARGEYFTWTSDDNIYMPKAFEVMYTYLEKHSMQMMVVCNMNCIDEKGNNMGNWQNYDKGMMGYANVVGACFLYRALVSEVIGNYDNNMFLVEDYDYWLRIIFRYGEIGYIDGINYKYRIHSSSLTEKKSEEIQTQLYNLRIKYFEKIVDLLVGKEKLLYKLYYEMSAIKCFTITQKELLLRDCLVLSKEKKYSREEKTYIYGAGLFGERIAEVLPNVVGFVDRDVAKQRTEVKGYKVISVKEYNEHHKDKQLVIALNDDIIIEAILELINHGIVNYCTLRGVLLINHMKFEEFVRTV